MDTCVESCMVSTWEGDHDLALVLDDLVVGDGVLAEDVRGDHAHLVPKHVIKITWEQTLRINCF